MSTRIQQHKYNDFIEIREYVCKPDEIWDEIDVIKQEGYKIELIERYDDGYKIKICRATEEKIEDMVAKHFNEELLQHTVDIFSIRVEPDSAEVIFYTRSKLLDIEKLADRYGYKIDSAIYSTQQKKLITLVKENKKTKHKEG